MCILKESKARSLRNQNQNNQNIMINTKNLNNLDMNPYIRHMRIQEIFYLSIYELDEDVKVLKHDGIMILNFLGPFCEWVTDTQSGVLSRVKVEDTINRAAEEYLLSKI